ncbi:Crp/Fnr family transcriptional regulator [Parvularcula marina]|uniref:Crp/Fnr family transcriptional regulator n=1 Tax=Parvularcula marina TaxID=2292771 RepID=A0A371RFX7_9PROT|nr:Crp/Fnr family transcriptional regulator [Parvularcula marina]RFB04358.1 Crp/Fnr family transcriptional regulator [Parvularcula marina]
MSLNFENIDAPCEDVKSCIAEKFRRIGLISNEHLRLLAKFEDNPAEIRAGTEILSQDNPTNEFFVINKGWVVSSMKNITGVNTVIDIHHPGDIVGVSQLPYESSPYSSVTATNCVICPFPRNSLDDLLKISPRLSGMFQTVCMIEQAILHDRIAMMSASEAHVRLCHFLLQTFSRLKFMNSDLTDRFYCPLNQRTIGEAIGVTSVHVSRTFAKLAEMGLIERNRNFVRFVDWQRAVKFTGFTDRYENVDVAWLPDA